MKVIIKCAKQRGCSKTKCEIDKICKWAGFFALPNKHFRGYNLRKKNCVY